MSQGLLKTVLVAGVLAILTVNALLINQNRILKDRVDLSIHGELHPGDTISPFGGVNLDGRFVEVSFEETAPPTLMISFSAGCAACKASLDQWKRLTAELSETSWRVLWLSRDPRPTTAEFSHANSLQGEVLTEFSCSTVNALGLRSVPGLVAVREDGAIERIWHGELTQETWNEISNFFRENPDGPRASVATASFGN
jgi:peroxiredoxin